MRARKRVGFASPYLTYVGGAACRRALNACPEGVPWLRVFHRLAPGSPRQYVGCRTPNLEAMPVTAVLSRAATLLALAALPLAAQQFTVETRDPRQKQDAGFEQDYKAWLANPRHGSPLVDHLPVV